MSAPFNENNCVVAQQPSENRWLLFRNPVDVLSSGDVGQVRAILERVGHQVERYQQFAAGFVSYEASPAFDGHFPEQPAAGFPKIWFGIYDRYEVIDFPENAAPGNHANLSDWELSLAEEDYRKALVRIKDYIREGDAYQVNYSFRFRANCDIDSWSLFAQMVHSQNLDNQPGYCVYVNTDDWAVCSASPELFLSLDQRVLTSRPMKGTAARGYGYQDDLEIGRRLRESGKNRAENIMITDMVRNDMGKIADTGTVETTDIFSLEKYPTFWAMTTTVECLTDAGLTEIFQAMFPAASITGAPKLRAMEIIHELENLPRYIYTGAAGFVFPGARAQFNVAIRTILIDKDKDKDNDSSNGGRGAEFGAGGGIVWDSDPGEEFQECHTKAAVLTCPQPSFDLLETLRWTRSGGFLNLDSHLSRLADSASWFSWEVDLAGIRKRLRLAEADFPDTDQRIRLLVSRNGRVRVQHTGYTPLPDPYRVRLAESPVHSENRFLYHKTTHREIYDSALSANRNCDDVLLCNERGEVTESCRANIIVELDSEFLTPPVSSGLLGGVGRALLLAEGKVTEKVILREQIADADSLWLVNSSRGCWRIHLQD